MQLASSLQWGAALKGVQHPLVSLLSYLNDGKQLSKLAHSTAITSVAFFPAAAAAAGQQFVLSADDDGRLKAWALRLLPAPPTLTLEAAHCLHSGAINCMQLHQPSSLLATAGDDACLRLWHLPSLLQCGAGRHTAAQRACLAAHTSRVLCCCFSSCGGFLASSSADGTTRLWHIASREPLATLQLLASSVAFAPGDDCALLVSATGDSLHGPLLLDLRSVPACQQFCAQLAAVQAAHTGQQQLLSSGGSAAARRAQRRQLDPATAVWLPTSPRGAASLAAAAAAATPGQQEPVPAAGAGASTSAGGQPAHGSSRRQVGSLASYSRRRRRRQEEAERAELEEEEEQQQDQEVVRVTAPPGQQPTSSSSSWLPEGDTPLRLPTWGAGGLGSWAALPASPYSSGPAHEGGIPPAAVLARYEECCLGDRGGGMWDASSRAFVYRQGGHSQAVNWALLLPDGLHVLTADVGGEARLWPAYGSSSSNISSASSSCACCALIPAQDGACVLRGGVWGWCRPALAAGGRLVVGGGASGMLHCWDLHQLQRQAHLPLNHKQGNAAASCRPHQTAVTAVAVAEGSADALVASGDASGRLVVRWA